MDLLTVLKECRACKCADLESVVSLGNQYVVDFVRERGDNLQAPLELVLCKGCGLLQLRHSVWKDRLYRKMWYRSGVNEQMRQALKEIATRAYLSVGDLGPGDLVLDIGCNDGTLLEQYPAFAGVRRVGIDPCKERLQEGMDSKRVDIGLVGYFGSEHSYQTLSTLGTFKVITAIAMFYDVEDPVGFLRHCKELMMDDGLLIIQQNYLVSMLSQMAFDNISHEHLCYYSLGVMKRLLDEVGLTLAGVETNNVNGGSFRLYITKGRDIESPRLTHDFRMKLYTNELQLMQEEAAMNLDSADTYKLFEQRKNDICRVVREYLAEQMVRGKKIHVYGASTRGTVTMQCLDLPETMLQHMKVAERDKNKYGLKMVGTWLPIVAEDELRKDADVFLVLPFHFLEGIKIREREFLKSGGELVVPLPFPRVVVEDGERSLLEDNVTEVIQ